MITRRRIISATAVFSLVLGCGVTSAAEQAAGAPAASTSSEATAAAPAKMSYSNKWRLECSGKAKSSGEIVFHLTPKGGATQELKVAIKDDTGENSVAQAIEKSLEAQLDKKVFHVEVDDGEDVLIKRRKGPDFAFQLVSSSVANTRFNLEKE